MSVQPSMFPSEVPAATPRAPYAPVARYGIRTLREHTADALSRLPSSPRPAPAPAPPSSAALPRLPVLGLTSSAEPLTAPAAALLARIRATGLGGYRLAEHDTAELLAAHDLYRRGAIVELGDWRYRATRASG